MAPGSTQAMTGGPAMPSSWAMPRLVLFEEGAGRALFLAAPMPTTLMQHVHYRCTVIRCSANITELEVTR